MKLCSGILSAAVLVAAVTAGCNESPSRMTRIEPAIQLGPSRTIQAGESARLTARTENLVGTHALQWSVSPNVARITPENQSNGQTALFSSDQPGVYVVTARADMGNGQVIASDTTITVNGRPITSERMTEPAPRTNDTRQNPPPAQRP